MGDTASLCQKTTRPIPKPTRSPGVGAGVCTRARWSKGKPDVRPPRRWKCVSCRAEPGAGAGIPRGLSRAVLSAARSIGAAARLPSAGRAVGASAGRGPGCAGGSAAAIAAGQEEGGEKEERVEEPSCGQALRLTRQRRQVFLLRGCLTEPSNVWRGEAGAG